MNTCGTCKHWKQFDERWRYSRDSPEYGTCRGVVFKDDDDNSVDAYVTDASDYYAALRCKSSFGCVLWLANESAT